MKILPFSVTWMDLEGIMLTETIQTNQFSSVAQSCPTLCDPMNRCTTGLPVHHCCAQGAKSPSDHQGAGIRCKSKRVFITKLELGLPPDTDTAAIGRSPGFCVTLLI